jgi:hypothetical protein
MAPARGRQQHRVRIGERVAIRVEDVAVEQVPRIGAQLMRDPGQRQTEKYESPCCPIDVPG